MKKEQSAAIPYRRRDHHTLEILLVTSRRKGRWVLPKGAVSGMLPHASAAREALEEAGVLGEIRQTPFGIYKHAKKARDRDAIVLPVHAFPLLVRTELEVWPEMSFRQRRWISARDAGSIVHDKGLAEMLRNFAEAYRESDPEL